MQLDYEVGFSESIINGLASKGHKMYQSPSDFGFAALTAIGRSGDELIPVYDHRRKGSKEIMVKKV